MALLLPDQLPEVSIILSYHPNPRNRKEKQHCFLVGVPFILFNTNLLLMKNIQSAFLFIFSYFRAPGINDPQKYLHDSRILFHVQLSWLERP